MIVLLVQEIGRARDEGEADAQADPFYSAVFFLLGLYALLTTPHHSLGIRDEMLEKYVTAQLRGMSAR